MTRLKRLHLQFLHTRGDLVELSRLRFRLKGFVHRRGLVARLLLQNVFSRRGRGRFHRGGVLSSRRACWSGDPGGRIVVAHQESSRCCQQVSLGLTGE